MSRIITHQPLAITNSETVITFQKTGSNNWPTWNRFIYLDGRPAYEIGNICGTCSFYFERLTGATRSTTSKLVVESLNNGTDFDQEILKKIAPIIPTGDYQVVLIDVHPRMVDLGSTNDYFAQEQVDLWGLDGFYNLPHNPKIQYYRGTDSQVGAEKKSFEFIIPVFPQTWLDHDRVEFYKAQIENGKLPTAISLSVLDVKGPGWISPEDTKEIKFTEHWCLAHYLLDGHHKIYAASMLGKSIRLLAFIALDECILNAKTDVDDLLKLI